MVRTSKKKKKEKRSSKSCHKKRRKHSNSIKDSCSDSSNSSFSNEERKGKRKCEDSSTDSDDHWVEKEQRDDKEHLDVLQRDSWMTDTLLVKTFTRDSKRNVTKDKDISEKYDPTKNRRELNPYWKSGGTGLPSFQKPKEDGDENERNLIFKTYSHPQIGNNKNWNKKHQKLSNEGPVLQKTEYISSSDKIDFSIGIDHKASTTNLKLSDNEYYLENDSTVNKREVYSKDYFMTDSQMNELGAKILKAEIMGNMHDVDKLKKKLEVARSLSKSVTDTHSCAGHMKCEKRRKNVSPTRANNCRNIQAVPQYYEKKQKTEAKIPDGDEYVMKERFESERYFTPSNFNIFPETSSKYTNPKHDKGNKSIDEHLLDNCDRCIDSKKNDKKLLITIGEKVYLALPWYIGLQSGHCIIIPNQHVSCSTQLDEDVWEEINCFRKSLNEMFAAQNKEVIYFEIANKFHRRSHLGIHCIPIDREKSEVAPFYFKKAIEESEEKWCVNKQLIYLNKKGLHKSIPKGLPYFWVDFGMDSGFAHVIEDETRFPSNFAQEIIGGMLELEPSKWRKLQKETNILLKVKRFVDWWKKFDRTLNSK